MTTKRSLREYQLSPQLMMPWHPGVTISTAQAAKRLGCSTDTVVRMIEDGTLEGFKLRKNKRNSHYKIIRDSVVRVCEEWRQEAGVQSTATPAGAAGKAG